MVLLILLVTRSYINFFHNLSIIVLLNFIVNVTFIYDVNCVPYIYKSVDILD